MCKNCEMILIDNNTLIPLNAVLDYWPTSSHQMINFTILVYHLERKNKNYLNILIFYKSSNFLFKNKNIITFG